jgi:hypothetical protein
MNPGGIEPALSTVLAIPQFKEGIPPPDNPIDDVVDASS